MDQDLPIHVDPAEGKGTITYATEVITTIVGVATTEVEGIASMAGATSISELLSGRPKNFSKGVRVEVGAEEVAVDVSVIVEYGMPIQLVGLNVQENIRKSIETMTGLHVIKVDVHVLGVSFEKENKELAQSQETAHLQSRNEGPAFGGALHEGCKATAVPVQPPVEREKDGIAPSVEDEPAALDDEISEEDEPDDPPRAARVILEGDEPAETPAEDQAEAIDAPTEGEPDQIVPSEEEEKGAEAAPEDAGDTGEQPSTPGRPGGKFKQKTHKRVHSPEV